MKDTQYFPQAQTYAVAATLMPAANEAFNDLRARLRRGRERLTLVLGASAHAIQTEQQPAGRFSQETPCYQKSMCIFGNTIVLARADKNCRMVFYPDCDIGLCQY